MGREKAANKAKWEYATRGGLTGRKYSWGDQHPSSTNANYEEHLGRPARVGSYPPNGYGLYDIAGNVFEWCSDWYDENYYVHSPGENPTGPAIGSFPPDYSLRVSRGGAWATPADYLRVGVRFATDFFESDLIFGFRCVVSASDRGNLGYRPGPTELKVEILGEGEGQSVKISQHLDENFNGVYKVREGFINGRPWYQNDNNRYLYFYDQAEGGEKSWSLDHRQPDGSKGWFSGGWTRLVEGLTYPQPGVTSWTAIPDNLGWGEIQEAVGHMGYRPSHRTELEVEIEGKALKDLVEDEVVDDTGFEKDGAKMVRIPGGSFEMGDHFNEGYGRELHTVELDGFYMDVHEVTVGQFKKFLKAKADHSFDSDLWETVYEYSPSEKHPMIYVTWFDAVAYAKWAGKRLPTEKEWEWATRGGLKNKEYSWGDDESLARDYANYDGTGGKDKWDRSTAPVGSFKPNGYGLFDMTGNVLEWCQDSLLDSNEKPRMLRGGGFYDGANDLRVAYRPYASPDARSGYGFRCVSGSDYP